LIKLKILTTIIISTVFFAQYLFANTMENKIKSEKEIIEISRKFKDQGKTVVTTNGSFDIFHFGHVKLFNEAKKQGDILIVGINSDKSVRSYKGSGRPINSEDARAGVVAALETVDYVFLFDDLIPNRWLKLIRPNVHCNSSEYGENCVERPTLDKIDCRLHLVERNPKDGLSTSNILLRNKP
jgi:rfaE bifunctional protein nucleotidyltransferase chain/domain